VGEPGKGATRERGKQDKKRGVPRGTTLVISSVLSFAVFSRTSDCGNRVKPPRRLRCLGARHINSGKRPPSSKTVYAPGFERNIALTKNFTYVEIL
jgi:hypothetical protein